MSQELWANVDQYISDMLLPADPVLDAVLQSCAAAGLPPISVSAAQGKFLHILARIKGVCRILEIGTLAGYSTIWLARALPPNGRLITLEIDPKHAEIARANIARASLSDVVELRLGKAMDTLSQMVDEGCDPFDFVFIDADKQSDADYFLWALKLSRIGTVIVVDNVVRSGAVTDPATTDPKVQGVRCFNEILAAESRVSAIEIQTVGIKGYDGFALALVNS